MEKDRLDRLEDWIKGKGVEQETSLGWLFRMMVGTVYWAVILLLCLLGIVIFLAFVMYVIPGGFPGSPV